MPVTPCTEDSATIQFDVDDDTGALTADVQLSEDAGNGISAHDDGLFMRDFTFQTSLPSSPDDGNRIILHDDTQGFNWPLQFRSDIGLWIPMGCVPCFSEQDGSGTIAPSGTGDWQDLSGTDHAGPSHTCKAAGVYLCSWGADIDAPNDGDITRAGLSIGGADPIAANVAEQANERTVSVSRTRKIAHVASGTVLQVKYNSDGSTGTATYKHRWLTVVPITLG